MVLSLDFFECREGYNILRAFLFSFSLMTKLILIEAGTGCSLLDWSCICSNVCFTWAGVTINMYNYFQDWVHSNWSAFPFREYFYVLPLITWNPESVQASTQQSPRLWPLAPLCFTIFPLAGWSSSRGSAFQCKHRLKNYSFWLLIFGSFTE